MGSRPALWLGSVLLLTATACGERAERFRISILLPDSSGIEQPVAGAEVRIVRGELVEQFRTLYRAGPEYRARKALAAVQAQRAGLVREDLDRARQELFQYPLYRTMGIGGEIDCREGARYLVEEAERALLRRIAAFGETLRRLGIEASNVHETLRLLEDAAESERREAARRRVAGYVRDSVDLHSQLVLDGRGPAWDRLCWKIVNRGPLNLVWADLAVIFDGRELPPDVAAQVWHIRNPKFRVAFERTIRARPIAGLASGESAGGCVYARRPEYRFPIRRLAPFGIERRIASRDGEWGLRIRDVALSDQPRRALPDPGTGEVRLRFQPRAPVELFADIATATPAGSARQILDAVLHSPEAKRFADARGVPEACKRVMELQEQLRRIETRRRAIVKGVGLPEDLQAELETLMRSMAGGKGGGRSGAALLKRLLAESTIASGRTGRDGSFETGLPREFPVTVVAMAAAGGKGWTWVLRVGNDTPRTLVLGRHNGRSESLLSRLARIDDTGLADAVREASAGGSGG